MKQLIAILLLSAASQCFAQDTISRSQYINGTKSFIIIDNGDTVLHSYYSNGQLEGIRHFSVINERNKYERYYQNGKKMWEMKLVKNQPEGIATYYNEKGKKIAQFDWENGEIKDTLFRDPKTKFMLGRSTYYSVVYGGMVREDGSSNVSGGEGIHMFQDFYTVKLDTTIDEQSVYKEFTTDFNGYFMVCVEKGQYGLFPKHFDIKQVKSTMTTPSGLHNGGINSSWNISSTLNFNQKNYQFVKLHFHSVGYAP